MPSASKPTIPQLMVPTGASHLHRPSPLPPTSPLTPTARNTQLNQRGAASLQLPALQVPAPNKSAGKKKVSFADAHHVELVSPCPQDYYGEYVKMTREERRWRPS